MSQRVLAPVLVVAAALAAPGSSGAWPVLVPATPDGSRPLAVAADGNGDVVTVGRQVSVTTDDDALLVKLAGGDGSVVWQQAIDGAALPGAGGENAAAEAARSLAIASDGDVVAAGLVVGTSTGADLLLTRRDAAGGAVVWQLTLDGGAALADDAEAMALDANGDVLVTGAFTASGATVAQPVVLKRAGTTGDPLWEQRLQGDGGTGRAIAVEPSGDVIVAGNVDARFFVTKHAAGDGAETWRIDLPGEPGVAAARAVALRPGGASVVAGRLFTAATGQDFTVVALAADGTEQWRYGLDGSAVGTDDLDDAFALAVDGAGDVIAAGVMSNAGTGDDLVVVKLAGATGAEVWRVVIDGANSRDDDAGAVAVDAMGDVAVAGALRNPGSGRDLLVLHLDGTNGTERWRRIVDGLAGEADVGMAVAFDAAAHVLAAGRTRNGGDSVTVLKLSRATGGDFPCGTGTVEAPEGCDDANLLAGDGCRPNCTVEVCGDGILDPQEGCDDGNTLAGDCCGAGCGPDADGTACDDADACTFGDMCAGGTCGGGVATVCPPLNDCNDAGCDPGTGVCVDTPKPNGRLCDDGDACTAVDLCTAGACQSGTPLPCDDFDPCTVDSCDPASGCVFDAQTSFAGVSCAFDPARIATFCFAGVPRAIERRIERATARVERAAVAEKVGQARKALKRAAALAEQARRRAVKKTIDLTISPACGAALDDILADVAARARALRDLLATESS